MTHPVGGTRSVWMDSAELPRHPALAADVEVDVCVVGAGIAGLTAAYLLALEGERVIVVDDGPVAGGETARTSAHLAFALDDRFQRLESLFGEAGTRLAAESHAAAVDCIEQIVRHEEIDCDFERVDGFLFLGPDDGPERLDAELAAARRAGLNDVVPVSELPVRNLAYPQALRFPRQGQFHPLRYCAGLAQAIADAGGVLHGRTRVTGIERRRQCRITTAAGRTVTARDVVVATNSPIHERVVTHTKQAPYRTFVIAAPVPRGAIPRALYWDTADPYHYVRLVADRANGTQDLVLVGGADHKTGQGDDGEDRFEQLTRWAEEHFPMIGAVSHRWSGQVMEPFDSLAYIGPSPGQDHIYMITGDSGHGLTHGTIGGMIVSDLIAGRENPWATLYDPARVTVRPKALGEFARENVNVAVQYADWLTPGETGETANIPKGRGAIIRRGITKLAVYRDPSGRLHERSAVCSHLGCVVGWNSVEQSWDCPCHGSRFDPYGEVLNGPAVSPLSAVAKESSKKR